MANKRKSNNNLLPGEALEKVVARLQQMLDPNSTVTHNERLEDRIGNLRQFDVAVRGAFGGRPMLGVIECKDHSRKKGPDAVEAFAMKTQYLGANLRIMVSRKGFTDQALKIAKHEHIDCFSVLPEGADCGFSVGTMWYGVIRLWQDYKVTVSFDSPHVPTDLESFNVLDVKYDGKPVVNWFHKELLTTYQSTTQAGSFYLYLTFDRACNIWIKERNYPVLALHFQAERIYKLKRRWVNWTGDALIDWHTSSRENNLANLNVPPGGRLVFSAVETDLNEWPDYDGPIPDLEGKTGESFIQVVVYQQQQWDDKDNASVPSLENL